MKALYISLIAYGLMLVSCGSNKTENDTTADTATADTLADAPLPIYNDTVRAHATDGRDNDVPTVNDTLAPAP